MLGGGETNGNTIFPGFVGENCVQYDGTLLPQLQLLGQVPTMCGEGVSAINYVGGGHLPAYNNPLKRVREGETLPLQQKLHISSNNNFCRGEAGCTATALNPNPVSTGLKLSCEEEEHNSTTTSTCKNLKTNLSPMLSLGNNLQMEITRQAEEFGHYIKLQEESILKGVREINRRHTFSLLNALEKGAYKKLHEKELEIESMNLKNKALGDQIKQAAMEAQSWNYRAKYSESVVNVLKSNIQQLMAQGTAQACEGSGDSEADDAASCSNHNRVVYGSGNQHLQNHPKCKACNHKPASILLMPCRHLCLCTDCEGFANICPVCQVTKTGNVHVRI